MLKGDRKWKKDMSWEAVSFRSRIPIPVCRKGVVKDTTSSLAEVTVSGATAMSASCQGDKNQSATQPREHFCPQTFLSLKQVLPWLSGQVLKWHHFPKATALGCEPQGTGQVSYGNCWNGIPPNGILPSEVLVGIWGFWFPSAAGAGLGLLTQKKRLFLPGSG